MFSESGSCVVVFVFKQKTAYEMRISDCSSDVCSSDLPMRISPWLTDRTGKEHGKPQGRTRKGRLAHGFPPKHRAIAGDRGGGGARAFHAVPRARAYHL